MVAAPASQFDCSDDGFDDVAPDDFDGCVQRSLFDVEAHYRSAFEDAAIPMSIATLDWRLLRVNDAHCRLLGYTEHELLTTDFRTRIHPDDMVTNNSLREDLFAGRIDSYATERRYFHKDGRLVWCIVTVRLVRDVDGTPQFFVGQMQDITERRLAEEALRQSQRRMERVLASSLDGIVIFDRDGVLATANAAAARIAGYSLPDCVGQHVSTLPWVMHGDDMADDGGWQSPVARALETGRAESGQDVSFGRPDGTRVLCVVDAVPLYDDEQRPDGMVVTIRDVSERRQMERQLEQLALHDVLTGLPNRRLFEDRAAEALRDSQRSGTSVGILFIDLDDFKPVNDRFGHVAGDAVLAEMGRRLATCVRSGDTIARIGGDEFAILLSGASSPESLLDVERRIREATATPLVVEGEHIWLSASVGSSIATGGINRLDALLEQADSAMYRAKRTRSERAVPTQKSSGAHFWTVYRPV